MNRLLHAFLCLVSAGFVTSFDTRPHVFGLGKLYELCDFDFQTLCKDEENITEEPTPFHNLQKLTHGQEAYPALKYGVQGDACIWQAYFSNKIQNEDCSAVLKTHIYGLQKQLTPPHGREEVILWDLPLPVKDIGAHFYFVYYSNPLWLHVVSFLLYSYVSYLWVSVCGFSGCAYVIIFGFLLMIDAIVSVISPLFNIVICTLCLLKLRTVTEDDEGEDEEDKELGTDAYHRIDNEEMVYLALPALEVV